uniref:Diphthine--ammonia ligase n=1 Tax=Neogobius melanostomus TaxID=47308 RepID=A0A8C6WV99_9GOBI
MRVVALISGGKDSCYNMMQCVAAGHRLVALANLRPAHTDELDSYMYQTVGHQAIGLYAEAMDLPLYRRTIQGSSVDTSRDYSHTPGDEVEDLYELLRLVKEKESVEAVSVGAILSDYQRVRVENVCSRLGLQPLAYLWRRDQESLLSEMVSADLHAILIKVAAVGLDPEKHLGKSLAEMQPYLKQLSKKYGVHICGEGGEYETFTLDCPLFKKKIVIDAWETVIHSADAFAPVGYLRFTEMHTENKGSDAAASVLPRGACPCRSAVDEMTEEAEYADGAGDEPRAFAWSGDLACQPARDVPPSWSQRTSRGFQWVAGINGLRSQAPDIQTQASAAFLQLQSELDSKGWNMTDIVLVHLYVKNMEDFMALNTVYKQHFGLNPPARVCVQAPLPDAQLLLMDCLLHAWSPSAVVGEDEECCSRRREALHVQSMSHWAPANIGPYSQAYRVNELVFCAGQIALVPCTMELLKAGSGPQARLSFTHVQKVLQAALPGLTLSHVLQAHCYTTRPEDARLVRDVWRDMVKAAQEEEDTLGRPDVAPCPFSVTVVPSLPKGASVELHVTASLDDPDQRTSCHVVSKMAGIECRGARSVDGRSACVSLSLAGRGLEEADVARTVQDLGTVFRKASEEMGAELVPLCARAFYKWDHPVALQVIKGKCVLCI